LNAGLLEAGISIGSLVRGFRPVRAARALTEKEPKPIRLTASPRLSAAVTASITASSARPASALDRPALSATWSINSLLFTGMLDSPCAGARPDLLGTRPVHGESRNAARSEDECTNPSHFTRSRRRIRHRRRRMARVCPLEIAFREFRVNPSVLDVG